MVLRDDPGSGLAKWPAGKAGRSDAERQGRGLRRQACISRGSRGKRLRTRSRGRGQARLRSRNTSDAIREIELVTSEFSDRLIQLPSGTRATEADGALAHRMRLERPLGVLPRGVRPARRLLAAPAWSNLGI